MEERLLTGGYMSNEFFIMFIRVSFLFCCLHIISVGAIYAILDDDFDTEVILISLIVSLPFLIAAYFIFS